MKRLHWAAWCLALAIGGASAIQAEEDGNSDLVNLVIGLLAEQDQDLRALGFEQIRSGAGGAAATEEFASQLKVLPPDAQTGLLAALAARGDAAARPAVLQLLAASDDEAVRVAAVQALVALGQPDDVATLIDLLAADAASEKTAARDALERLAGDAIGGKIAEALEPAGPYLRVALIEILATRRAFDQIPVLLHEATDDDAEVRAAAMAALGQLAGPEQVAGMVQGLLAAKSNSERAAAEKAIMFACGRTDEPEEQAVPLLAAMEQLSEDDRLALLSTLGRVGGPAALPVVEAAITSSDEAVHDLGIRAIANWPTADIAPRLLELVETEEHADHRTTALRALIRVAPLRDARSAEQRLALLQEAWPLCERDEERRLIIDRAKAVRIVETLRFLTTFLDDEAYAEPACLSIVELAHHRQLRDDNKEEFHAALDRVIATSKNETVVDRAERYKAGRTWVRPK